MMKLNFCNFSPQKIAIEIVRNENSGYKERQAGGNNRGGDT